MMILAVSTTAPLLLRAGAATLLAMHIGGSAVAIVSGWVSILARKGRGLHRRAGVVFFFAMLASAGVGAAVAPFLPTAQWTNTVAGLFTLYMITTSWAAVRRGHPAVARFETVAIAAPIAIAIMGLGAAAGLRLGSGSPSALFVFGSVSALAAVCDYRVIVRGKLSGPQQISRHLWRMSTALIVATASYFLGQPRFVPAPIRGTFFAALPVLAAFGLLVFWMLCVRLRPQARPAALLNGGVART